MHRWSVACGDIPFAAGSRANARDRRPVAFSIAAVAMARLFVVVGRRAAPASCGRPPVVAVAALVVALGGAASAPAVRAEDPVVVDVTGPLSGKVGDRVSYEVELVNRSGRNLEKLRIIDYFDAGFHHEASVSPIEQKGTIDLAAGTARRLTLEFLLDEPGRQCHRVEIIDQNHQLVGKATECILVLPAPAGTAPPPSATPAPTAAPAAAPTAAPTAAPIAAPPTAPAVTLPPAAALPSAAPLPAGATFPPAVTGPQAVPLPPPATSVLPASPALASPTTPIAPALSLGLSGPAEVASGATASYVATVRNTGSTPTSPTKLDITWDDAFSPQEASDGYALVGQSVTWTLPSLAPGGELRRQINLRPQATAGGYRGSARGCVKAILTDTSGGEMVADESCALIRSVTPPARTPREAGLRVSLADLDDPVGPGGGTTVVCTVTNEGTAPTGKLAVVVAIPDQARFLGDPVPSRVRIEGRSVTFDAVGSIPPGGHATFEVTYRLPTNGIGQAIATVTGDDLQGAAEAACTTSFLGP